MPEGHDRENERQQTDRGVAICICLDVEPSNECRDNTRTEIVRWSFAFWIGQIVAIVGLFFAKG